MSGLSENHKSDQSSQGALSTLPKQETNSPRPASPRMAVANDKPSNQPRSSIIPRPIKRQNDRSPTSSVRDIQLTSSQHSLTSFQPSQSGKGVGPRPKARELVSRAALNQRSSEKASSTDASSTTESRPEPKIQSKARPKAHPKSEQCLVQCARCHQYFFHPVDKFDALHAKQCGLYHPGKLLKLSEFSNTSLLSPMDEDRAEERIWTCCKAWEDTCDGCRYSRAPHVRLTARFKEALERGEKGLTLGVDLRSSTGRGVCKWEDCTHGWEFHS